MSTDPADKSESTPTPDAKKANSEKTRARIPEPRVRSPELKAEYEKRSRERIKRDWRKRQLRNAAALLVFLGIPFALVFYFSDANPWSVSKHDVAVNSKTDTDFEKLVKNADVTELINYSDSMHTVFQSGALPQQHAALVKRIQIAEILLTLEEDEESIIYGVISKIDALIALDFLNVLYKLDEEDYRSRLLDFCNEYVDNSNPQLKNRANLGLTVSQIHAYLVDSSDENFERVKSTLDETAEVFLAQDESSFVLKKFVPLVGLSKRDDHVREFKWLIGHKLESLQDPQDGELGAEARYQSEIDDVDYDTLRRLVLIRDEDSLVKLEQFVNTIAASPIASPSAYRNTLSIVEDLGQIDEIELQQGLLNKLRKSIEEISYESKTRNRVEALFADYDKRSSLIGKVFDLKHDSIPTLENSDRDQMFTVVVFFSVKEERSTDWVSLLSSRDYLPLPEAKIRFVLVSIDEFMKADVEARLNTTFVESTLIKPPESGHYHNQCPVSTVPYMLILDQYHRVVYANVAVDELRQKIQALFK